MRNYTGSNSRLALDAILQRSETVLKKYMQEEKLIGNCPPSRYDIYTPLLYCVWFILSVITIVLISY